MTARNSSRLSARTVNATVNVCRPSRDGYKAWQTVFDAKTFRNLGMIKYCPAARYTVGVTYHCLLALDAGGGLSSAPADGSGSFKTRGEAKAYFAAFALSCRAAAAAAGTPDGAIQRLLGGMPSQLQK